MTAMLPLLTIVALFSCNAVSAFTSEEANAYIDQVLSNQFQDEAAYSRIDPATFPDIQVNLISRRITENKALLTKGQLFNLSKLKRQRDCSVPLWTFANVSFTCDLSLNDLLLNYTASVTFDNLEMTFKPSVHIDGTVLTIQVTTAKLENIPNLKRFSIQTRPKMDVELRMLSIGDVEKDIAEPIKDGIVRNTTVNFNKALFGRFRDALAYSIYKTPVSFVDY